LAKAQGELPMRLALKTEYACQVLAQLARSFGNETVRQVDDLARAEALSPNYLVQILTGLRAAGLVVSRRGKNGGYRLARHPSEITLSEIAIAMEGERLIESSPGNSGQSAPAVREIWQRVDQAALRECNGITLSELIADEATGDWMI
jgi:Rrf2 family transcriptional regulator, cysteine metabolism repressor